MTVDEMIIWLRAKPWNGNSELHEIANALARLQTENHHLSNSMKLYPQDMERLKAVESELEALKQETGIQYPDPDFDEEWDIWDLFDGSPETEPKRKNKNERLKPNTTQT